MKYEHGQMQSNFVQVHTYISQLASNFYFDGL